MNSKLRALLVPAILLVSALAPLLTRIHRPGRAQWVSEPQTRAAMSPQNAGLDSAAALREESAEGGYHWQAGDHAAWRLDMSLREASDPAKINQSAETRFGGQLHWVVLGVSNRVTVAACLSGAYCFAAGIHAGDKAQLLETTPALLTLDPAGKLMDLSFPGGIERGSRNFLRLVYGWEWVLRHEPFYQEQERGSEAEENPMVARYRRGEDGQLSKTRSAAGGSVAGAFAHPRVFSSQFAATVGRLWLAEMSGWEDTMIRLDGPEVGISRVAISLHAETNAAPLPVLLSSLLADPAACLAFGGNFQPSKYKGVLEATQSKPLSNRWAGAPLDQVLESLKSAAETTLPEATQTLQDLKDWLAANPAAGPEAMLLALQTIQTNQWDLAGSLVYALTQADGIPAGEAVVSVLQNVESYPPSVVLQAAQGAGSLDATLHPALKEALLRLLDSSVSDGVSRLSDMALLAFARMAKEDAVSQALVVQRVIPWLQPSASPEETVKGLNALAKAAINQPEIAALAAQLAQAPDENIRVAAGDYLESLSIDASR